MSYRLSKIDHIRSFHSAGRVGWWPRGGELTQCFMLVIHLGGKLGSGRALGTDPPSTMFRRMSGMSGVFLLRAVVKNWKKVGPWCWKDRFVCCWALIVPGNTVCNEAPVSMLPPHLRGVALGGPYRVGSGSQMAAKRGWKGSRADDIISMLIPK